MTHEVLLTALFVILLVGVLLVILLDTGNTYSKLAWIMIIALLPVVGVILYLLFGLNHRHRFHFERFYTKFAAVHHLDEDAALQETLFGDTHLQQLPDEYQQLACLLKSNHRPSVCTADEVEIITSGQRKLEALLADMQQAKHCIYMEYFHFGLDTGSRAIRDMLIQKAKEGVDVRFVNENLANLPIIPAYYEAMRLAGVRVVHFTDIRHHFFDFLLHINYRDHRKIVVIDNEIGYIGGMNINNHYFYKWRDTHLRLRGEAVKTLLYLFWDSWSTAGGTIEPQTIHLPQTSSTEQKPILMQIVPDAPDSRYPILQMSYEWALQHAKHYIYLQTPYFVPPEPLLNALKAAALRGVEVRLMLPKEPDSWLVRPVNKSYYKECLEAGVRIFERGGNFMHCKTFIMDDYLSQIGSANIDYRSFDIDYEANCYIYDADIAAQNKAIFEEDLAISEEVTLEQVNKRKFHQRFIQSFFRLFAPIL